jgi:hypothetical protein
MELYHFRCQALTWLLWPEGRHPNDGHFSLGDLLEVPGTCITAGWAG